MKLGQKFKHTEVLDWCEQNGYSYEIYGPFLIGVKVLHAHYGPDDIDKTFLLSDHSLEEGSTWTLVRDTALEKPMLPELTTDVATDLLMQRGVAVDRAWSVDDVDLHIRKYFELNDRFILIDDKEKMCILESVLAQGYGRNEVNDAIYDEIGNRYQTHKGDLLEPGLLFDANRGVYMGQEIQKLALKWGWQGKPVLDTEHEEYHDAWTEAAEHLDQFAPDGHWVGSTEHGNDFGVWPLDPMGEDEDEYQEEEPS